MAPQHSRLVVIAMCVVAVGMTACRSRDRLAPSVPRPAADASDATPQAPAGEEADAPARRQRLMAAAGARAEGSRRVPPDRVAKPIPGQLPPAEIEERLARPIEESVYDPTLTKDEKIDLLYRHYHSSGRFDGPPDELLHAVLSEDMTDWEAAEYWDRVPYGDRWARYHAAAVLRSNPTSVDALLMWAKQSVTGPGSVSMSARSGAYLAVLQQDPTHPEALLQLANTTLQSQPLESGEYAKRMIDAHPDSYHGYLAMGMAYEQLRDVDAAKSYYDAGMEAEANFRIQMRLDNLENVRARFEQENGLGPIAEPAAAVAAATDRSRSPTPDPAREPSSRRAIPDTPEPPAPPGPPPETPAPVQKYQDAMEEYRSLADEFESITGQKYGGLQDFDDYAKQTTNWMAWRYMELGQQYVEAGKPDKAAEVFEKAERQFPDDPLIQDRVNRSR